MLYDDSKLQSLLLHHFKICLLFLDSYSSDNDINSDTDSDSDSYSDSDSESDSESESGSFWFNLRFGLTIAQNV